MSKTRDEYGFTKASDVDDKASALRRIIAAHEEASTQPQVSPQEALARLRAVHAADRAKWLAEEAALIERNRLAALNPESVVEELPVIAAAPVAEPEPVDVPGAGALPDFTDSSVWIRVEQPEMVKYTESDGPDESNVITRWVSTGRKLITYRPRTPADGDTTVEYAAPNVPAPAPPERMAPHKWGDTYEQTARREKGSTIEANRSRLSRQDSEPRRGSFLPGSLVR